MGRISGSGVVVTFLRFIILFSSDLLFGRTESSRLQVCPVAGLFLVFLCVILTLRTFRESSGALLTTRTITFIIYKNILCVFYLRILNLVAASHRILQCVITCITQTVCKILVLFDSLLSLKGKKPANHIFPSNIYVIFSVIHCVLFQNLSGSCRSLCFGISRMVLLRVNSLHVHVH